MKPTKQSKSESTLKKTALLELQHIPSIGPKVGKMLVEIRALS